VAEGLANDAAVTILLGGYAQSGVPVVPVK
jgi:hypothetical protein